MLALCLAVIVLLATPVLAGTPDPYNLPKGIEPRVSELVLDMDHDGKKEHFVLYCRPTTGEPDVIYGRTGEVFLRMYAEREGGRLALVSEVRVDFVACPPDALSSEPGPGIEFLVIPERGMRGDAYQFFVVNDGELKRADMIRGQTRIELRVHEGKNTGYTFKDGGQTLVVVSTDPEDKWAPHLVRSTLRWNGSAFVLQQEERVPIPAP